MYSFQPLVDTMANTHFGFYIACVLLLIIAGMIIKIWNDYELSTFQGLLCMFILLCLGYLTYHNSYAPEKVYANTPVTATFVGFQPEGYNEKHGKSRADHHYMYVVYDVNGERVILLAGEGMTYPKTVTLYKN